MASRPTVCFDVPTPVSFLDRSAVVCWDREADVYGDRRYTFKEFHDRVHCPARALLNVGTSLGDIVAVIFPNIPQMLRAHYADTLIGTAGFTRPFPFSSPWATALRRTKAKCR